MRISDWSSDVCSSDLVEIVTAHAPETVGDALDRIASAGKRGLHAAGTIAYEVGYALEPRLTRLARALPKGEPLLWFGLFKDVQRLSAADVPSLLHAPAAKLGPPSPQIEQRWYAAAFERVQSYIRAGDIYQANLTFSSTLPVPEDPCALYVAIRGRAQAGHGGIVFIGAHGLLSFQSDARRVGQECVCTCRLGWCQHH